MSNPGPVSNPEQVSQEANKRQRDPIIRLLKLILVALIISLFVILIIELVSYGNKGYQYGGFFSRREPINFDIDSPSEVVLTAIDGFDAY